MGRGSQAERTLQNIVELRQARRELDDQDSVDELDDVIEHLNRVTDDLRQDVGEVVPKSAAARILGISRPTLDKWVDRGLLPLVKADGRAHAGVARGPLEELAAEVTELRRLGENKSVIAEALSRLAESDPEFAGMNEAVKRGLAGAKKGRLVPLKIPDDFGPED